MFPGQESCWCISVCCTLHTKSRPCTKFVIRPNSNSIMFELRQLHLHHTISQLLTGIPLELTRLSTHIPPPISRSEDNNLISISQLNLILGDWKLGHRVKHWRRRKTISTYFWKLCVSKCQKTIDSVWSYLPEAWSHFMI